MPDTIPGEDSLRPEAILAADPAPGGRRLPGLRAHLVAILLVGLLPALAAGLIGVLHAVASERAAYEGRLRGSARALALALDAEIGGRIAALQAFAASPAFGDGTAIADAAALHRHAGQVAAATAMRVAIGDAAGRMLLHHQVPPGQHLPDTGGGAGAVLAQAVAEGHPVVSGLIQGPVVRAPALAVVVPVPRADGGRPVLSTGGAIDPGQLDALLAAQTREKGSFAGLVDAGGALIARSDGQFRGAVLPSSDRQRLAAASEGVYRRTALDGTDRLTAFAALRTAPGWTVLIGDPYAAYRAAGVQSMLGMLGGIALALLAAGGLALLLARRMLQPLGWLVARARAIALDPEGHDRVATAAPPARVAELEALRQGFAAAEAAIAERRLAERAAYAALAEQRAMLQAAQELSGVGGWTAELRPDLPLEAQRLRWTGQAARIYGHATEPPAIGLDVLHASIPAADRERIREVVAEALRTGRPYRLEHRIIHRDGRVRLVEVLAAPAAEPGGAGWRLTGCCQDVTDRRVAEHALAESTERLRELLATLDLAAIMARDPDGAIRFWSAGCTRLYGWTAGEALGRSSRDLLGTQFPAPLEEIEATLQRDGEWTGELRHRRRDGEEVVVVARKVLRRDTGGQPLMVTESVADVTAQKSAEARLAESEARLRLALSGAGLGLWELDLVRRRVRLDARAAEIVGGLLPAGPWVPLDGPEHRAALAALHPQDRDRFLAAGEAFLSGPEGMAFVEARIRIGPGWRWLAFHGTVLEREAGTGQARRALAVLRDATAAKEAEASVRRSEALFRASFDQAAVGIAHVALDGTWLRVNDRLCGIVGYPRAALLRRSFQEITHPEDLDLDLAQVRALLDGRIDTYSMEKRYIRADGGTVWVNLTVSLLHDAEGRAERFVSIVEDISARKAAQAALAESEAMLRRVLDNLFVFVGLLRADGTLLDANRAPLQAAGLGLDSLRGKPFWQTPWWAHDAGVAARIEAACAAAAAGEPSRFDVEARIVPDTRMVLDFQVAPLRDEAGRVTHLVPSAVDITERRRSEEATLLLAREVDHRAKNALAVVQSILTLTRTGDPAEFKRAVLGRVAAMARAHTLLARERWNGADLRSLLEEELAPHRGAGATAGVTLSGPPTGLAPEAAQPVAMAVHELATNAAKYGALSVPGGTVAVSWQADGATGGLLMRWREAGGPPVTPPARRGFGTGLIENTVRRQLQGELALDWAPLGLDCSIRLPPRMVVWRR
ncbi:PAS domain S-box protein [Paracraurococcus ruber]|uniref:histidine kinase n=1 Tax=Paracraurococcus ruber TaxID=77675 RepID=A0ABS1CXN5_9PROT|nr:PAS domain S-box protein [Paracraurococcus ruber]MBK1658712.1 hypothetical protein [Paracraurococcus ruber]TDG30056.1 PAS domain S-box protein [Paracraurococcus ruber]